MDRLRELLATTDLSSHARLLYVVLGTYEEGGEAQLSTRTLTELMGCGHMSVRKATKELEDAGFIETEAFMPTKGRETAAKIYRLI